MTPSSADGSTGARRPPSTVSFAAVEAPLDDLAAATLAEMDAAWHAGRRVSAEEWLARDPRLAAHPETAVQIVFEEVCLREELGEHVDSVEIFARFPQWKHALEVVLDCHRLMDAEPDTATFPGAGTQLGELQLLCELGRGGQGRVFLATQPSLSDRPLVVKVTPRHGGEHLALARLQHTHVAPLYLVQEFPERNLRALCMPYLGGASWAHVLQAFEGRSIATLSGADIARQVQQGSQDGSPVAVAPGPAMRFLARATYVEAVCWIGACLADALQYAHQRGLVHLDIKPSNVLVAGDGQPMLLDFHLAREVLPAGAATIERLGGTRGYMSPEQQQATAAVREGRALPLALDGRSDIYSLGVLLYESLAGRPPASDEQVSRRVLRQANPTVTRGLADILHKCLARDATLRYRDAGELATDLRRHLASLPLAGVPNRSLAERLAKWRRRKPHAPVMLAAAIAGVAIIATAAWLVHRDGVREARQALADSRRDFTAHDYASAAEHAVAGSQAIRWLPWQSDLRLQLGAQLAASRTAQRADALHALVEQLQYVDGFPAVPSDKLRAISAQCDKVWQRRAQIVAADASAGMRRQLQTDLLDLALLWARIRVRVAGDEDRRYEQQAAVALLDDAQRLCGPNPAIEFARRGYRHDLGIEASLAPGDLPSPRTAWQHFAVGRTLLQSERLSEARQQLEHAVALAPGDFWPNFYRTLCAYRQHDFEAALSSACVCVALAPANPASFYNRAVCYQAVARSDQALADLTRALALDPAFFPAALQRGIVLAESRRYADALADFRTALDHGAPPADAYYQMALAHLAQHDRAAAQACLGQALQHSADYGPALALVRRMAGGE